MNLKEILERNPQLTLEDLQALQTEYDRRFVNHKFKDGFGKVQHTYAHMGKLLGRLAEYVEAMEEGREVSAEDIRKKVVPDLLVYSAWLASEFGVRMDQAYLNRFTENLRRLYADKIPAQELAEIEAQVEKKLKSEQKGG
jgi:hypothetical protein